MSNVDVSLTKDTLSEEQHDRIQQELFQMLVDQKLYKESKNNIARRFREITEVVDGVERPFFMIGSGETERLAAVRTLTIHISRYIDDWETTFASQLRVKVMEKMVEGANSADKDPHMLRFLGDKVMPQVQRQEVKHEGEIKHSARLDGLLAEIRETNLSQIPGPKQARAIALHAGTGEEGHEVSVRDSAGSEGSVALDVVPPGDD